jgi:glycerol-3-phosphate acyltransferase PlsY
MFPIWLKFNGGKGVATFLGTIGAISWAVLLGTGLIWGVIFAVCRISSVSCLIAVSSSLFLYRYVQNDVFVMGALIFLVILIFIRHKDNLIRLHNNQEKQI